MNMHGIMVPRTEREIVTRVERSRRNAVGWVRRNRMFLLVVALPTLLVAGYYYLIASDQYVSEAHFVVRSSAPQPSGGAGMSLALSAMAGGAAPPQNDISSVSDYLNSHDAVAALARSTGLVGKFQRPGIDTLSRLHGTDPAPEKLLNYYLDHVSVKMDPEVGIAILKVRAFEPADAYEIAEELLRLGEQRVNVLNDRSYTDAIASSQRQLAEIERNLSAVQLRLMQFRTARRDIDPKASGQAQLELVSKLRGELATARAQQAVMGGMIARNSPQYVALAAHIRAVEAQLAAQSGRLTGDEGAIAEDIGGYESLQMRQQFLTASYQAAAGALDRAREQAQRQQLYLVRVVEPNMPVKSLYPQRGRIVLTVFAALLVAYALGWLIVAGTREHAA